MQYQIQTCLIFHTAQTLLIYLLLFVHLTPLDSVLVGQRPLILKYVCLKIVNLEQVKLILFEIVHLLILHQLNLIDLQKLVVFLILRLEIHLVIIELVMQLFLLPPLCQTQQAVHLLCQHPVVLNLLVVI